MFINLARLVLTVGGGLSLSVVAFAQQFPNLFSGTPEIPEVTARFETTLEPAQARPGEHVRMLITAHIVEGWYTYSVVPQGELAPPPTTLTLFDSALALDGPVYETNPQVKEDPVFGIPLAFHKKTARFYQNLRVPETLNPAQIELKGKLRYQTCNSTYCTPPRDYAVTAALSVLPGAIRPPFAFPERSVDFVGPDGQLVLNADTLESALAGGLGGFLLLAVGFGLLALLTPCVFPMIPVTVSFFTGVDQEARHGVFRMALLFGAGIIVSYTGLGLALTFFLGASGVSQFASNPWVNLVVAGFFVVFAFSLLGLFELGLPSGVVNRLSTSSYSLKGPLGVMVMGVAFAATSFTCTVPFVGTLLVAATQGRVFWPVVGMLVFSAVFALPFVLLALFPRHLASLRGRSGNWLVQIKVVLGLVELVAALKFVSNADLMWRWGVFTRTVLLGFSALAFMTAALVLLGLIPWPGVTVPRRSGGHWLAGATLLLLTLYMGAGVGGRELDSYTEAYLPPPLDKVKFSQTSLANTDYVSAGEVENLGWLGSVEEGLARAKATGKPVFVDFTGYTCINCRWMEKKIFAARPVYEAFRNHFVLV
ncbi:MAG: protein-disulfide reductase DsbD family protein, partial [Deltaproteobacteria bacterium]|nr:protein-disulfide reductase DsbD family protein [Deltaproteobacteria bacterium]